MSLEKAKKLKALADRGYKSEKSAAMNILKKFIKKHDIDFCELDNSHKKKFLFKYKNGEDQILVQIIAMVSNNDEIFGVRGRSNKLSAEVTEQEAIEIAAMYDHYSRAYNEEIEIFMRAFISKNNLYRESTETKAEYSTEDLDKAWRAMQMAHGIKRSTFRKQISNE